MKAAFWMYSNTDYGSFTMTTPNSTMPIIREVLRRGHELVLNHVPRPPHDSNVHVADWDDPGEFKHLWDPQGKGIRAEISAILKKCGSMDQQNRAQRYMVEWVNSAQWPRLEADVQLIKSPPLVSLRNKLEMAHAILRAVLSDVPVVVLDADYDAVCTMSTLDDLYKYGGWPRGRVLDLVTMATPYERRIWSGFQTLAAFPHHPDLLFAPANTNVEADFHFGYVGNDYGRDAALGHFYKYQLEGNRTAHNAVWGRWDLEKFAYLKDVVGEHAFMGPIPPKDVIPCYQRCAASIAITHDRFYPIKQIGARWYEVIAAGRLLFADRRFYPLHPKLAPIIDESRFVSTAEEAYYRLRQVLEAPDEYALQVAQDRDRARKNYHTSPQWWGDALEALAADNRAGFHGWIEPDMSGRYNKWEVPVEA